MEISFYLFLGMCEFILALVILAVVQAIYLKKYRPYFLANTKPEMFLKKYIQQLIKQTQKFAKGFEERSNNDDKTAIETQQHMAARLNWLVLERDFSTTTNPDIRYWEDINVRIQDMLKYWKEVKYIAEPPDIQTVKLAIDGNPEDFDFENTDIDQAVKDQISALKKKAYTMSRYESMYKEMDGAYKTLEASYNELRASVTDLKVDSDETEKLKTIIAEHQKTDESLSAMLTEIEASKEKLNQELSQLEDAYGELERESMNSGALKNSSNPDAKEIVSILDQQKKLFDAFKKTLNTFNMKPAQQDKINKQTGEMEKAQKEINFSMQMLELERERLEEEVKLMQENHEDAD